MVVQLVDDDRCEAHGKLVDEEQRGFGRERPGHGKHLLLAARHGARGLLAAFAETRELREREVENVVVAVARIRGHPQVLRDREIREDAASLRYEAHTRARERV